jgi:spore maturation protein CgeB
VFNLKKGETAILEPKDQRINIFKNSKLIINVDPNWASGVHDRVFNAISSGAAVYTNGNKYTEMYFRDSYNMGLYKSVDDIKSKLYYHLSNAPEYVNNSHKTLNPLHSYKNRILPLVHP